MTDSDTAENFRRLVAAGQPGRFDVQFDHIVESTGSCNCATPDPALYGHVRGCGLEPVMTVAQFRAMGDGHLGMLLRSAGATKPATDHDSLKAMALRLCGDLHDGENGQEGLTQPDVLDHVLELLGPLGRNELEQAARIVLHEVRTWRRDG